MPSLVKILKNNYLIQYELKSKIFGFSCIIILIKIQKHIFTFSLLKSSQPIITCSETKTTINYFNSEFVVILIYN